MLIETSQASPSSTKRPCYPQKKDAHQIYERPLVYLFNRLSNRSVHGTLLSFNQVNATLDDLGIHFNFPG